MIEPLHPSKPRAVPRVDDWLAMGGHSRALRSAAGMLDTLGGGDVLLADRA